MKRAVVPACEPGRVELLCAPAVERRCAAGKVCLMKPPGAPLLSRRPRPAEVGRDDPRIRAPRSSGPTCAPSAASSRIQRASRALRTTTRPSGASGSDGPCWASGCGTRCAGSMPSTKSRREKVTPEQGLTRWSDSDRWPGGAAGRRARRPRGSLCCIGRHSKLRVCG